MTIINSLFMAVALLAIAGIVAGSIFLATQRFIYKFTTANFLVSVNKIMILTFVIPFFWILGELDHSNEVFMEYDPVVLVQEGSMKAFLYEIREAGNLANVISIAWFIGVILYLLLQAALYYRFSRDVWAKRLEIKSDLWQSTFQSCTAQMKMDHNKIGLYSAPIISQPCTVGVWKKNILISEGLLQKLTESEINIILSHELTHIRKNYVALKVLMFVLSSLNWFNPVLHMLKNSLNEWIEISCDEELTVAANSKNRESYANVLVKLSANAAEQRNFGKINAITYFGTKKSINLLKKRIVGIMKKEQNPDKVANIITIAGTICAVALGTIIAKEMDYAVNAAFSNHVAVFDESEITFEEVTAIDEGFEYTDFDENLFEKQVAGINERNLSISYEIVYMDNSSEMLVEPMMTEMCDHPMEKVNVAEHKKNTDGSCVVLMHEGLYCKECETIILGGMIYTSSMVSCVH